ncbi:hypothetical protein FNF28_01171 [Cafeteria roenbergensis]|uniref:glutaminase n=1 Tax=Cafeteria roenbergensis TaxID=33653 RepID=A0A5A8E0L4_CAFRO|nr:hypothetical protein FNF28_01171 [Cafeteria roenbergensis]
MPLGVDQFRRSKRDAMPREDLVNLLEGLGIRTTSGYVAREIEQLTRADGQVSLPLSRSHIFTRATQGRLAIPAWNEFAGVITDIADGVRRDVTGGANADYIQVLRDADPTKFAVSVVTVDGQRYNYGDFSHTYSMQSCSKPLTYAIAVDEAGGARGLPFVHSHVGSEASGLAFNSISVNDAGLPHNPMVNAGAIASVGLVGRHCPDLSSRFAYLMGRYREVAGDTEVGFSQATYLCELETAWRNNAILYTLSEAGVFNKRTHPYTTLDLYIQACATEINTETAAMIAATFANGGVQPITGKRVLSTAAVKAALTLCFSCGLYDGSGTWAVNVGLPAKSGVAGLIYVIIPGVAGVAVFSPPLDEHGNSVRAVAFCERLVRTFPFGLFDKAVSDVLSELSPPIDPHMLYLPPHLRRARAVMEAVRNRLRKAAKNAAKYGGAASMAAASAAAAARAGFGPAFSASLSRSTLRSAVGTTDAGNESEDSDDETAWAEAAVFRAQQLGIDVDYGIDYSSAFRLLQEPALDPDKEADADGGGEDEAVSLAPVAPALLLSHKLFPDVSVVPSAGIEAWRFASFLASKGMACTHANNPRVTFLLVTLARDTGVIRFQDLVLSPVAAADALLLRALLGKLVVDDFQGVRQSIRDMATAVLRFVPPVPIRRDGTVPPSAVAEFNERQRLHQADGMAAAAAAASALSHRGGSTGGRSDAGDAFAAALSAPAPQRRRQVSHGHDSGAGVTGDAATLASEQEEDSADALREAAAIKSAADPLHDLKEQMGSHGAAGAGGAGGAGGGAASGAGAGAGAGTGEDGAGGAGSAAGRYMSDTRRSKVDEHRDALDEELKSVCGVTPDTFGVALCTCDGQYACMGDSTKRVPIMEIAFPLLYAMAMEDSGADAVNAWAGTEPSSHPPDSFTLRDPTGGGHGGGGEDTKDDDEGADGEAAAMGTAEWEALPEDVRLRLEVRGLRRRTRVRRERRRRRRQQRRRWREMRSRGGREALIAEQEEAAATDSETTDSDSAGDESEAAGAGPAASAAAAAAAARERDGKEDSGTDDEAAESLRPQRGQRITQVAPLAPTAQAAFPSGGAGLALDLGAKRRAAPAKSGLAPILGTQARGARAGAGIGGLGVPVAATGAGMAGRAGTLATTVSGLPPMPPPARRFRGVAGTGSAVLHDAAAMGGVDPSRDHKAMPKPGAHRPYNACTLAGALTVMSCVGRGHLRKREQLFKDSGSRFTHVVTRLQEWAGDTRLGFNNAACLLLKQRFLRCLAMAHYLKGMEALPPRCDPTDIAQALVQCMSVEATVRQLATLAATFARAGACPTTDRRCMRPSTVKNTLSMTYTCGMGPISGTWTFNIALPATVGCMGVTLVVIPGLGGLALLDGTKARLDPSRPMPARSLKFCEMLVRQFRVNMFDALIVASSGSGDSGQQITNASEAKATAASAAARRGDLSATLLSFELISASGAGDLDKVMSLIKMGADVSSSDYDARTALHISCCEGHLDIVAELTRQGADPLVRDRWGQTPFAEASRCGHGHIVTFLESHLVSHGQQPPLERHAEPAAGEEAAAHPRG